MGLLRHRHDEPAGQRFQMRERLLSIGDDFWTEDDQGKRAYKVDGKALCIRDTFVANAGPKLSGSKSAPYAIGLGAPILLP